jgi:hypothetical protein
MVPAGRSKPRKLFIPPFRLQIHSTLVAIQRNMREFLMDFESNYLIHSEKKVLWHLLDVSEECEIYARRWHIFSLSYFEYLAMR